MSRFSYLTHRNDEDRAQWIDNDEALYNWWKSSKQGKRRFVKENREEIDRIINAYLSRKPVN